MTKSQPQGRGLAVIALIVLLLLPCAAGYAANPALSFGFVGNGVFPTRATDNSEYYVRFYFDKGDNDNDPVYNFQSATPYPPKYPPHNSFFVKNLYWFLMPDIDTWAQKSIGLPSNTNYRDATLAHERINYLGDAVPIDPATPAVIRYPERPCWVGSGFTNPLGALQVGVPFPTPPPLGVLQVTAGFALSPLNVGQTVAAPPAPLQLSYGPPGHPPNSLIGLSVLFTSGAANGVRFPVDPVAGNTPAVINVLTDNLGRSLMAAGVVAGDTFVLNWTLSENPLNNNSLLSYDTFVAPPQQGYPSGQLVGWYVQFTTGAAAAAPPFPITNNWTVASPDVGPPQIWNNSIALGPNSAGNSIVDAGAAFGDQFNIVSAGGVVPPDPYLNVAGGGGLTAAKFPYSDVPTGLPIGYPTNSLVGLSVMFSTGPAAGIQFPILANTQGAAWPPLNFATITVGLSAMGQTLLTAGVRISDQFAIAGFTAPTLTQTSLPYSCTNPLTGVPGVSPGYPGDLAVNDSDFDGVDNGPAVDFLYHSTPGRGPGAPRGAGAGLARGRMVRFSSGTATGRQFYIEANNPNTISVFAPGGVGLVSAGVKAGDRFFIVDDEFWATPTGYPYTMNTGGALTGGNSGRPGRLGYGNANDLVADVAGTAPPWLPFYDAPADVGDADVYVLAQQSGRAVRFTVGPFSYRNSMWADWVLPYGYILLAAKDDNLNAGIEDGEWTELGYSSVWVYPGRWDSPWPDPNVDSMTWFNQGGNPKLPDPLVTDPEEPVNKDDGTGSSIYTYTANYINTAGLPPRWNRQTTTSVNFGSVDAPENPYDDWFYDHATGFYVTDDWTYGSTNGVAVILDGLFFWPGQMNPIDTSGNGMTPAAADFQNGQWYRAVFQPNYLNDYVAMGPGLHSYQFMCSDDFSPPDNRPVVCTGRPAVSYFEQHRDAGDDVFPGGGLVHGNPLPEPIPWNMQTYYSVHAQLPNAKGVLPYPLGAPWWLPTATAWLPPYGIPAENVIDGYTGNPDYVGQRPLVVGVPYMAQAAPDPFNYNPWFKSWGGQNFLDSPDVIGTTAHRVRDVDPVLYAINDPVLPRAWANYPQPGIYRFPGDPNRSLADDLGFPSGTIISTTPEMVFQYPCAPAGTESGPVRQNDATILPDMTPARQMTLVVDPDSAGPLPPQLVRDPIWASNAIYTLRIRYVHDAGRAPTEAKVGIRRRGSASPFFLDDMTKLVDPANQWGDGNFRNGELYYYRFAPNQLGVPQGSGSADPSLRPIAGQPNDYEYYFRVTGPSFDGSSTRTTIFPRRPPGDSMDLGLLPTPGADVYWFRINSKPILAALSVSPNQGNEGTNFVYTITYTDPDGPFTAVSNPTGQVGDAPYAPKLYVDIFGDQLGLLKVDATTATGTGIETLTYSRVSPLGGAGYRGNNSIGGIDSNGYDTDTGANHDELYHQDTVTLTPRRAIKFETGALRGMIFPVNNNSPTTIAVSAAAAIWGAGPAASGGASIDAGDRFSIVDFLPVTMYPVNPGDNNYRDGAQYRWDSGTPNPFTAGTLHDYYAEFDDDPWDWFVPADPNFTRPGELTRFPQTFNLVGPTIIANQAPFLATFRFAPDPPPPGTGSPDGNTATDFTFYVDYYDADDNVPTVVRLRLRNIDTNTYQEFPMAQVDPADTTYSNGATFFKTTKLGVGRYEFWAQCNDGQQQVPDPILAPGNAEWTGPQTADPVGSPPADPRITVTAAQPGPEVIDNTPPILAFVAPDDQTTPPLRPGLEPDNGTPSDTFTYTVKYLDNDIVGGQLGNPPSFVNVIIDGTIHAMAAVDPSDTDYTGTPGGGGTPATGGADFRFVTTTPFTAGLHNYYFQASDGEDTVRLPDPGTLPGPFIDAPAPPPRNLSASDVVPDQGYHIRLQWDASLDDGGAVDDVLEYRVFRTTLSGTYIFDPQDPNTSLIAVIPATNVGTYVWVDGQVFPGGTPPVGATPTWTRPDKLLAYFYVVRAMETTDLTKVGNASSTSNQAPGTTVGVIPADNLVPATPGGISCTPDVATGYVLVRWQASANDGGTAIYPPGGPPYGSVAPEPGPAPVPPNDDVVGYRLYRDTVTPFTPSAANLIADETVAKGNLISGTRTFLDKNTVLGSTYYYKVVAFDGANASGATPATGGCLATDSTAPSFLLTTPSPLINVPADTNFAWTVSDAGTGVKLSSIKATLDTWPAGGGIFPGVTFPQIAQPANLTITPTPATTPPASYDVVWNPPFDLPFATTFILTLQADDLLPPPTGPNSGVATFFPIATTTTTGVSGTITLNPPLTGATTLTVTATGGVPLTIKTVTAVDVGGGQYNYVVAPLPAGNYNVQPSFPNTTFVYTGVPPMPVNVVLGSLTTGVNFTGNVTTVAAVISGTVSYPTGNIANPGIYNNIKIDVTGPVNKLNQPITSAGIYSVSGLVAGSYTVTPKWIGVPPGLLFSPPPATVSIPPSATDLNFIAYDPFPGFEVAFGLGTQLVSYPFSTNAAPNVVFGTASPTDVARWDPRYLPTARYIKPSGPDPDNNLVLPVRPGRGYFTRNASGAGPGGTAAPADRPFDIPLWDEWNTCGNPWFAPFFWNTVAPSRAEIASFAWVYVNNGVTAGYVLVTDGSLLNTFTSIAAYRGFWLRVAPGTGLCSLRVPVPGSVVTAAAAKDGQPRADKALLPDGWAIRVTAAAADSRDEWNFFGVGGPQVKEAIRLDNPPAMAGSVDVYFDGEKLGLPGRRLATDIRTTEPQGNEWEFVVGTDLQNVEVTVALADLSHLAKTKQVLLTDIAADRTIFARTQSTYVYNSGQGGERRFKVTVSDRTASNLQVLNVTAKPSRAGPGAEITYTLSAPAQVTTRIVNIAGRVIAEVETGAARKAGASTVTWSGRTLMGTLAPNGPYLIRVSAVTETQERADGVGRLHIQR